MSIIEREGEFEVGIMDGDAADPPLDVLAALYRDCFPGAAYTGPFLQWKHFENPEGRSMFLYARALDDGALAAARALWRHDLRCDGEAFKAWQPCDTATHPDFQRRGLFTKLTRKAIELARDEGGDVLFNFPNELSVGGYLKLGWQAMTPMRCRAQPLRPVSMGVRLLLRREGRGLRFEEVDDAAAVDLGDVDASQPTVAVNEVTGARSAQWWRWRLKRSGRLYRVVRSGDAFALWTSARRMGLLEAVVCDVHSPSPQALRSLWPRLMLDAHRHRAHVLTYLGAEWAAPLQGPLRWCSMRAPTGSQLVARALSPRGESLMGRRWALQSFDIDTF